MQTSLADTLDNADYEAKFDNNAKCILADKGMLAFILSHTIKAFKGMSLSEIIPLIEGEPTVILDNENITTDKYIPPKINGMNVVLTEPF